MLTRSMVKQVLDDCCQGRISKDEAAEWAYQALGTAGLEFEDEVTAEALYNLVSFHSVGSLFAQFRPSEDKLAYLNNWLTDQQQGDWDQYQQIFSPGQLS